MMLSFLLHVPWLLNDSLNKLACQVNIDSILNLEAYYKFSSEFRMGFFAVF